MKKTIVLMILASGMSLSLAETKEEFAARSQWYHQTDIDNGKVYLRAVIDLKGKYDFWMKIEKGRLACDTGENPFIANSIDKAICDNSKKSSVQQSISHMLLDCKKRKVKRLSGIGYNYDRELIAQTKEEDWDDVYPDSIGEDIANTLCLSKK
ncbi:surface-adhesin E family protein [Herbaspirillum huttiense]|uniref:surface-adhesin E family protein n=1 Tax=Herbaspirillum huttiense TaxID=863372 RepID=UPI0012FF1854|nr:surface-adhesin E family protein [Herbaspirillum huttiense]